MSVTASIVIDFGALENGAHIAAELDENKNGGKTTFLAGDVVYFRVYADIAYAITPTSGDVVKALSSVESETIGEILAFVKTKQAGVQKKIKPGTLSWTWYGNNPGNLLKTGATEVTIDTALEAPLAVGKVEYKSEYDLWTLTPPAGMASEYAILILVTSL
jgi:hypothetical protein